MIQTQKSTPTQKSRAIAPMLLYVAAGALMLVAQPALATSSAPPEPENIEQTLAQTLAQIEHDKLFAIFAEADEGDLQRNPINAIFRGDLRYADRLGDYGTDDYTKAERAAAVENLRQLEQIDRTKLNSTDRIAYDVFAYDQQAVLKDTAPEILALTDVRPLNHFRGIHSFYPNFASGAGAAPFKTVADYENNLKRHKEFVAILDRYIARFKEGQRVNIVETKMTIVNMIGQLDTQLAQPIEESPFWGPVTKFPENFTAQNTARLTENYRRAIAEDIYPALTRLRDYLRGSYMAHARDGHGLLHMKGGNRLYQHLIEQSTTLPLTAEGIHQIGLKEVARIIEEMDVVRHEVGFGGSLAEFFDYLRTDPQFKFGSRTELTRHYYDIGKRVNKLVGKYFNTLPKAPLEIRPYETFREKYRSGGSYQRGTPDGSRPGVFYFNAYDLPSRTIVGTTTLYLHEGAPGHHFQISLAQENKALPAFIRFGGKTAYVEGWALYSETLGYDMGLFKDPYQRFGTLSAEMLRAMRLVVDTGIHAKGWTRNQAIDYMMSNSDMGRTKATAQVERYIVIPGQALAYKIGALTIQRLRDGARESLGAKFDIREFHEQILGTGALPLAVLEKKIWDWVEDIKLDNSLATAGDSP